MFKVCVYFGAVTGGKNDILGSAQDAGTHVFRTHSITFTRNDVYPPTLLGVCNQDLLLEQSERGPPSAPALGPGEKSQIAALFDPVWGRFWPPLTRENTHPPRKLPSSK